MPLWELSGADTLSKRVSAFSAALAWRRVYTLHDSLCSHLLTGMCRRLDGEEREGGLPKNGRRAKRGEEHMLIGGETERPRGEGRRRRIAAAAVD